MDKIDIVGRAEEVIGLLLKVIIYGGIIYLLLSFILPKTINILEEFGSYFNSSFKTKQALGSLKSTISLVMEKNGTVDDVVNAMHVIDRQYGGVLNEYGGINALSDTATHLMIENNSTNVLVLNKLIKDLKDKDPHYELDGTQKQTIINLENAIKNGDKNASLDNLYVLEKNLILKKQEMERSEKNNLSTIVSVLLGMVACVSFIWQYLDRRQRKKQSVAILQAGKTINSDIL